MKLSVHSTAWKRFGILSATLATVSVLGQSPVFAVDPPPSIPAEAGTRSGMTGDWGFPLGQSMLIPAGEKLDLTPVLQCEPEPDKRLNVAADMCMVGGKMKITMHAVNGAYFTNTVEDNAFNLVTSEYWGPSVVVASCSVKSKTLIECPINAAAANSPLTSPPPGGDGGLVGQMRFWSQDFITTSRPVQGVMATKACTPSFQLRWENSYAQAQEGRNWSYVPANDAFGENDTLDVWTTPPCSSY
ncbi:hypothetical protein [Streptomyces sp. NPDC057686]|uniref:hypothetical protein n=1 Tax=Streptomyces sp. NPDC057686 TaxID=3346212 RepID=UPI003698FAB1